MSSEATILPGARVRAREGIIGTVERLDSADAESGGQPTSMVVRSDDGRWRYRLPLFLVGAATQGAFYTVVHLAIGADELTHYIAEELTSQSLRTEQPEQPQPVPGGVWMPEGPGGHAAPPAGGRRTHGRQAAARVGHHPPAQGGPRGGAAPERAPLPRRGHRRAHPGRPVRRRRAGGPPRGGHPGGGGATGRREADGGHGVHSPAQEHRDRAAGDPGHGAPGVRGGDGATGRRRARGAAAARATGRNGWFSRGGWRPRQWQTLWHAFGRRPLMVACRATGLCADGGERSRDDDAGYLTTTGRRHDRHAGRAVARTRRHHGAAGAAGSREGGSRRGATGAGAAGFRPERE